MYVESHQSAISSLCSQRLLQSCTERLRADHCYHLASHHQPCLSVYAQFLCVLLQVLNEQERACQLAQQGIDGYRLHGSAQEEVMKDSTLILQLLRDNLALWNDKDGGMSLHVAC